MVARPGQYRAAFTSGELSDQLHGATGLKSFYTGLALAQNVEPPPQGGLRVSPRSRFRSVLRRAMAGGMSIGAATASVSAIGDAVSYDFGAPMALSGVDLSGVVAGAAIGRAVAAEIYDVDAAVWTQIGVAFAPGTATEPVGRRLAFEPGRAVRARYLRLRLIAAIPPTTLSVANVTILIEATIGRVARRLIPFTARDGAAYVIDVQPGHIDIYRSGAYVGACWFAMDADQLTQACIFGRGESLFFFHQARAPARMLRHGVDGEWSYDKIAFARVPNVRYDGAYADQPEQWLLFFRWPTSSFDARNIVFTVTIDGASTGVVGVASNGSAADWPATAAALQTAMLALATVAPGLTVSAANNAAGYAEIQIAFAGANAGANFAVTAAVTNTQDAAISCARWYPGKYGGEPIMSDLRGWPACAAFYQDRLVMAGFRSEPAAFLASRTGEYFDLNIEAPSASAALLVRVDVESDETIVALATVRHLVLLTNRALYYCADRAVAATTPPNIVRSERYGVSRLFAPQPQEDALLLVNERGTLLSSAKFDAIYEGYSTTPLSLKSTHLVKAITGGALQKAGATTDAERLFLTRADGLLVVGVFLRTEEVVGFVRWATDGAVAAVAVDGDNAVWLAAVRPRLGDADAMALEELEDGLHLDSATTFAVPPGTVLVGGLERHEGQPVWTECGGIYEGPFTVANGAITPSWPLEGAVTVGRWTPPRIGMLPLVNQLSDRVVLKRPGRIHTLRVDLLATTSLAVAANGGAAHVASLGRFPDVVDRARPAFTGQAAVSGLTGYMVDPVCEITQTRPGALHVRDCVIEARL